MRGRGELRRGLVFGTVLVLFATVFAVVPMNGNAGITYTETKMTANDGAANDYLGNWVSIEGDTAVGSAPTSGGKGAVYVFERSGTTWKQTYKLTANDAASGDQFGWASAISEDENTIIASARLDDDEGANSGSAYVFIKSGSNWVKQAKLTASDGVAGDRFGAYADITKNTIVISSLADDSYTGSAYVFERSGSTWTQSAKLTASDRAQNDLFGQAPSINENADTIVVGARTADSPSSNSGAAYIFVRSGSSWIQQAKLTANDAASSDQFGVITDISGDTVVIGSWYGDTPSVTNSGAVYVYKRSGTTWTQQAKITASDASSNDQFAVVDIVDNRIIVGAKFGDSSQVTDSGATYIFEKSGTSWTETTKITASDAASNDWFGWGISSSGATLAVCARHDDNDGGSDAGAIYIYDSIPTNTPPIITSITGPIDPIKIGDSVAMTGTFTDSNSGDTHTAKWNWGDSSESSGTITSGTVTGSHSYSLPGVYTLTLSVTDDAGASDTETYGKYVVIYDPTGGFVTGGGWISSPSGAYTSDTSLSGKANFGFVAKYKKGATVPSGNVEFHFVVGDMNFNSKNFNWLVVAGCKAKLKGSGTINGEGSYGFMISAIDGDDDDKDDTFRIKIWDKDDNDAVVYDNQMDDDEGNDPTTKLGGGNIVVHTPG
jgi:hypothetical protein